MPALTIRASVLFSSLGVLAAAAWLCAQQQAPDSRPTFSSSTDLVRLEVSVLDKHRHPVRGLSAADFEILENGKERPVVAFTPVELPSPPAASAPVAPWVRDAPQDVVTNTHNEAGRLVVIAFDWSIRMDDQTLARRIALAAVDALGPADEATVVFTKPSGAAGQPQGFTNDHAWLRAAIARPFAAALTCPPLTPGCGGRIVDPEGYQSGECLCGMCTLEALTRLAQTLRTVSQRPKAIIFIGTYVRTFEMMVPTHIPVMKPGEITPTFTMMPGATDCSGRLLEKRRAFEHAAAAANITVHVLDPVGQETDANSPLGIDRMRERLDTLPVMADMTGGRTVLNTNAPETQVPAILEESSSYYLLGFNPASATQPDKSRSIDVRVRPGGLKVKARSEYTLADEAPVANASADARLTRTASGVLPGDDVPFEVSAVPMIAGRRAAAVIVGRVEREARPTRLLTAAFTPTATPVVARRLSIRDVAGRATGSGGMGLVSALALEPGFYELRVATELSGGATGSVHTFVAVPDFKRELLSMSGVLLHVVPEEPAAPREEIDDVLPFVPTAQRTFNRGDVMSAFVQISQGTERRDRLQSVTVRLRIIDAQDAAVRDQSLALEPAAFAKNRTANSKLMVPTAGLVPGRYLLRLSTAMGERHVERTLRFEMR